MLSGWMNLLFRVYKYFLLVLSPSVLSDLESLSLESELNSQGCLSLSDFVLNPPMGGDKADNVISSLRDMNRSYDANSFIQYIIGSVQADSAPFPGLTTESISVERIRSY